MKEQETNETVLIGSIFQNPENWMAVREIVKLEDFTDRRCMEIFNAIEQLEGKYDLVILTTKLKEMQYPGLIPFATEIITHGNSLYAIEYANIVHDSAVKRKMNLLAEDIKASDKPIEDTIRDAESKLVSLYPDNKKGFSHIHEIIEENKVRLVDMIKRNQDISGLTTGFRRIDLPTDGLKNGELIIIGARPSIGKTALMVSMADHIAVELKKNVAIFSIESSTHELFHRFISQRAKITTKNLRLGKFTEWESSMFKLAIEIFDGVNLSINDIGSQNLFGIRSQIYKLINSGKGPDIIFIDYLQRMEVEKGYDSYALKIGKITKGLKNIAKEMNIPIVALAQINRNNGEAFPRLMDLKESGEIEADADIVILLHREEFYKKENCPMDSKGKMSVDIAKNRNGPVELIELNFEGQFTRITE